MKKTLNSFLLVLVMFVFLVGRANVVHSQESESAGNSADPFRPVLPDRNMVPVIYHPDGIDQDFDRIVDSLEDTLGRVRAQTQSGESDNIPQLNRGEKDGKEGYGRICADAAIEAATMIYETKASVGDIFGSSPSNKKVWARQVLLSSGNEYEFSLTIPPDADYDLYLYKGTQTLIVSLSLQ